MEQQTAVEWLEERMPTVFKNLTINKHLFEQAKEMENQTKEIHKQEIIKAAARGYLAMAEKFNLEEAKDYGQQYYDNICGGKDII